MDPADGRKRLFEQAGRSLLVRDLRERATPEGFIELVSQGEGFAEQSLLRQPTCESRLRPPNRFDLLSAMSSATVVDELDRRDGFTELICLRPVEGDLRECGRAQPVVGDLPRRSARLRKR